MKRILMAALIVAAVFAVVYGLAVFVTLVPDPREWSENGRFGFALMTGLSAYMAASAYLIFGGDA